MKILSVLVLGTPIWLLLGYSTIDPLTTATDYKLMDSKIVKRMRTSKKEIWDDMVDDIVFYTHSLVNFLWSLEQNHTGILETAISMLDNGQPQFINQEVNEKVKNNLKLDEWDLYRFTTLRTDAQTQWQKFVLFVNELRLNQTLQ
ncbi:hypothetical protein J6590_016265 [Homalodisca vitripennis]|nr:hypothetical protein J6590_016265 [Homalodisca vitripennis]